MPIFTIIRVPSPPQIFYTKQIFLTRNCSRDSFLRAFIVFLCNVNRKTFLHWGLNLNIHMQNACQVKKLTRCQRFTGCHDVIQLSFVILQKANYTMSVGRKKAGSWPSHQPFGFWLHGPEALFIRLFFPFQIHARFKWACVIKKAFFSYPSKRE